MKDSSFDLSCDCIFAPSQVRLHQIGGQFLRGSKQERVLDSIVRNDGERRSADCRYAASDDSGKRICRGFHISVSQYQVHVALHETPKVINISFSCLCFVDGTSLYNLANKANLVHNFS